MHKSPVRDRLMSDQSMSFAGCDTGKDTIDICLLTPTGSRHHRQVANTADGLRAFVAWLAAFAPVRVVVEASGRYSLDLSLALHEAGGIEVMVANPRALKDYRRATMERSKTDKVDAASICDFASRMAFVPWQPPDADVLELQQIARRIEALIAEGAREKNRLQSARATKTASHVVTNDIEVNGRCEVALRHLERRIAELEKQALRLVTSSAALAPVLERLTSVRGIATRSAVRIMSELLALPDGLTVRQWVAYAGLDVRKYESGTSVEKRPCISKVGSTRLRCALYMPALVASQKEPAVKAYADGLKARGKKPKAALVAVMRKLLHAIYGMLKHEADFDGSKFYAGPITA